MSSVLLRRAGLVTAAGSAYVVATVMTYKYLTAGVQEQQETEKELLALQQQQQQHANEGNNNDNFSFVSSPGRNLRYETIARVYDDQIDRDEMYMGINILRRTLLYFHARGTVLEVAAGTGRNLWYYPRYPRVDRVILSDTSNQMLSRTKQKLSRLSNDDDNERRRFACLVADGTNLSMFPDNCFDTVVDTFGLCSFDDPVAVLNEMSRVCKNDGGKILLLEHGRSKSWTALSAYLDKHAERHARNWGCVWNRDLDDILDDASLIVERKSTWHFGTTYYVVCRPDKEQTKEQVNRNELASL